MGDSARKRPHKPPPDLPSGRDKDPKRSKGSDAPGASGTRSSQQAASLSGPQLCAPTGIPLPGGGGASLSFAPQFPAPTGIPLPPGDGVLPGLRMGIKLPAGGGGASLFPPQIRAQQNTGIAIPVSSSNNLPPQQTAEQKRAHRGSIYKLLEKHFSDPQAKYPRVKADSPSFLGQLQAAFKERRWTWSGYVDHADNAMLVALENALTQPTQDNLHKIQKLVLSFQQDVKFVEGFSSSDEPYESSEEESDGDDSKVSSEVSSAVSSAVSSEVSSDAEDEERWLEKQQKRDLRKDQLGLEITFADKKKVVQETFMTGVDPRKEREMYSELDTRKCSCFALEDLCNEELATWVIQASETKKVVPIPAGILFKTRCEASAKHLKDQKTLPLPAIVSFELGGRMNWVKITKTKSADGTAMWTVEKIRLDKPLTPETVEELYNNIMQHPLSADVRQRLAESGGAARAGAPTPASRWTAQTTYEIDIRTEHGDVVRLTAVCIKQDGDTVHFNMEFVSEQDQKTLQELWQKQLAITCLTKIRGPGFEINLRLERAYKDMWVELTDKECKRHVQNSSNPKLASVERETPIIFEFPGSDRKLLGLAIIILFNAYDTCQIPDQQKQKELRYVKGWSEKAEEEIKPHVFGKKGPRPWHFLAKLQDIGPDDYGDIEFAYSSASPLESNAGYTALLCTHLGKTHGTCKMASEDDKAQTSGTWRLAGKDDLLQWQTDANGFLTPKCGLTLKKIGTLYRPYEASIKVQEMHITGVRASSAFDSGDEVESEVDSGSEKDESEPDSEVVDDDDDDADGDDDADDDDDDDDEEESGGEGDSE